MVHGFLDIEDVDYPVDVFVEHVEDGVSHQRLLARPAGLIDITDPGTDPATAEPRSIDVVGEDVLGRAPRDGGRLVISTGILDAPDMDQLFETAESVRELAVDWRDGQAQISSETPDGIVRLPLPERDLRALVTIALSSVSLPSTIPAQALASDREIRGTPDLGEIPPTYLDRFQLAAAVVGKLPGAPPCLSSVLFSPQRTLSVTIAAYAGHEATNVNFLEDRAVLWRPSPSGVMISAEGSNRLRDEASAGIAGLFEAVETEARTSHEPASASQADAVFCVRSLELTEGGLIEGEELTGFIADGTGPWMAGRAGDGADRVVAGRADEVLDLIQSSF